MKSSIFVLLWLLSLSIFGFAQSSIKSGNAAPAFSGVSLDGTPYDIEQLRGSVVVITFWSTRCAICHSELPKLNRVAESNSSNNVVFLALSMENGEKINTYLTHNPFKFKVLPDSFGTVLKYADRDRSGNLDMGFPSYFVIDKQGVVRHRSNGYDKTSSVAAAVGDLLAK